MNNPTTWYRKRYALGGGIIGGASGYGIAHLLKGSSLTKLISAIAGAGLGGTIGYQIGKNKDIARLSDVSVLKDDDTLKSIGDAMPLKTLGGKIVVDQTGYSDMALGAGIDADNTINSKGDKVTNKDTANAIASNANYTKIRLKQIENYLKNSDQWERASLFGGVYRNKRTNAIYDLSEYKKRLHRSVAQYDATLKNIGPFAMDWSMTDSPVGHLYDSFVHIPMTEKTRKDFIKLIKHPVMHLARGLHNVPNFETSSFGTAMTGVGNNKAIIGGVNSHEYNHIGSIAISDNLMPSNIIGTDKGLNERIKGAYSIRPAEVAQHLTALNQRYHRMTGEYVKDKDSFFKAVKHMARNIQDVGPEGRRTLQMLAGLYNDSKRNPEFERALQNYAEIAPVLI